MNFPKNTLENQQTWQTSLLDFGNLIVTVHEYASNQISCPPRISLKFAGFHKYG